MFIENHQLRWFLLHRILLYTWRQHYFGLLWKLGNREHDINCYVLKNIDLWCNFALFLLTIVIYVLGERDWSRHNIVTKSRSCWHATQVLHKFRHASHVRQLKFCTNLDMLDRWANTSFAQICTCFKFLPTLAWIIFFYEW